MYLIPEPISCAKEITFESRLQTALTNPGLATSPHENPIEVPSETLKNDKFADKTVVSISRPAQSSPHYQHQAPSSQQHTYHQQPQAQPQRQHPRYFNKVWIFLEQKIQLLIKNRVHWCKKCLM